MSSLARTGSEGKKNLVAVGVGGVTGGVVVPSVLHGFFLTGWIFGIPLLGGPLGIVAVIGGVAAGGWAGYKVRKAITRRR